MGLLKAALMGIGSRPSPSGLGRSPYARRTDASSRARRHVRWWPEQAQRHRLKVLHDGGKVELVACAGETAQPQSLEAVVGQVREQHLDALALTAICSKASVPTGARASSRASSWMLREILRASSFGQHRILNGQPSQSSLLALYSSCSTFTMLPVVVNNLPAGHV
jgi:hypothetical protein